MRSSSLPGAAARAGILGFAAGLRSQIPLALLARNADTMGPTFMGKTPVRIGLYLSAAGEAVVDKLPIVPSRLEPGSLTGRLMLGSLSGALLARRLGFPAVGGVLVGAAGALAGSFAGYHTRTWLTEQTGLPGPVWAVLEDGAAVTLGVLATRE